MGKSVTPKYVVVVDGHEMESMAWDVKHYGAVNEKNLEKWVIALGKSMNPGNVNQHLRCKDGTIPYPQFAYITLNELRAPKLAEWKAPMFMVW